MPMEFIGVLHRQTAVHCPASLHLGEQEICPLLGCIFSTPRHARMMRRAINTPAAKKSDNNKQRHVNLSKPLQTRMAVETRKPGAVKTILTHK
jgi:hypothetical protein